MLKSQSGRLTSINLSIVASVGRYVMRNFMFLYSISAGSGLRTFMPVDDIASISGTTRTLAHKRRFSRRIQSTTAMLGRRSDEQVIWRHWKENWAISAIPIPDEFTNELLSVCFGVISAGTSLQATPTTTGWSLIYIVRSLWLDDPSHRRITASTTDRVARLDRNVQAGSRWRLRRNER